MPSVSAPHSALALGTGVALGWAAWMLQDFAALEKMGITKTLSEQLPRITIEALLLAFLFGGAAFALMRATQRHIPRSGWLLAMVAAAGSYVSGVFITYAIGIVWEMKVLVPNDLAQLGMVAVAMKWTLHAVMLLVLLLFLSVPSGATKSPSNPSLERP